MARQESTGKVEIHSRPTIIRIFQKICQSNIKVLLRLDGKASLAIKATAVRLTAKTRDSGSRQYALQLGHISARGMELLQDQAQVQVEFVLISNKLICVTPILQCGINSIMVAPPASLTSIERRQNARFKTSTEVNAFVALSKWQPTATNLLAAPFFSTHADLADKILVADISLGGVCLRSLFPGLSQDMNSGIVDNQATLCLPLQPPIPIALTVRWTKKIIEHLQSPDRQLSSHAVHLVGCQFIDPSPDILPHIKSFIKSVQGSGSV